MATMSADLIADEAVRMAVEDSEKGERGKAAPVSMHFTDFTIVDPLYKPINHKPINFKHIGDQQLQQFTEGMLSLMERHPAPLYITVDVLLNFFMDESIDDMKAAVRSMTDAALESGRHRITFSTCRYAPDMEKWWSQIGDLNRFIRQLTAEVGEQPLSCHKVFLIAKGQQLATCSAMYDEWYTKKSLGRMPTEAAVNICVHWVRTHHEKAYNKPRQPTELKKSAHLPLPIPLGLTEEYYNCEYMVAMLRSRGMYMGRRPRSAARRGTQRRGSHRTVSRDRSDSVVSFARPRGGRSPNSVGALERLLNKVAKGEKPSNTDPHAKERETSRVTGRIAMLYKAKCEEVTRLSVEIESMRLELELQKDRKDIEMEAEVLRLKKENTYFRQMQDHYDKHTARLGKLKDSVVEENKQLYEELQLLKLSKKERRAERKELKKRKYK